MDRLNREQIDAAVEAHWQWLVFGTEGDGVRADFSGQSLRGAHLNGANLSKALFVECDLASTNLAGAKLAGASFAGADLTGADLSGSDLTDCNFHGADLEAADVSGARAPGADFTDCRMPVRQHPAGRHHRPQRRKRRWLYPALGTAALLLVLAYLFGWLEFGPGTYDALLEKISGAL